MSRQKEKSEKKTNELAFSKCTKIQNLEILFCRKHYK